MLPDLSLLLALLLGLMSLEQAEAAASPLKALGGTAATILVVVALGRMAADRAIAAVEERDADALVRAGRFVGVWPFLGWVACLWVFDWGAFVAAAVPRTWWIAPHIALFTPLAILFASGWMSVGRVEAKFAPLAPTAWGAVRRALRRNAMVLVPMAVLIGVKEAFQSLSALGVPGFRRITLLRDAFPDIDALMVLAVMAGLAWFAPVFVRRLFKTKPFPNGEIRDQIEALLKKIGVRARELLLWDTGGRVMNAMVVGLSGRTRYVIVSDALVESLAPHEVLAVVAHEAGHAKLHHLPWYFVVSLASLLLVQSLEEALLPWMPQFGSFVLSLAFLGFFWFGMLGWLSRRFERQADVFGAAHAGDLEPGASPVVLHGAALPYGAASMISALERVGSKMGTARSHRHGSPAERTRFLAALAQDEDVRREYARDTSRLTWMLRGFFVLSLATTIVRLPAGVERGEANLLLHEGVEAALAAQVRLDREPRADLRPEFERARAKFAQAASRLARRPDDIRMKAIALEGVFDAADLDIHHLGRYEDARAGFLRSIELAKAIGRLDVAPLVFNARIELGRLALRLEPVPANAVAEAKRYLKDAEGTSTSRDARYRDARVRLLASAIELRDPDPGVVARAKAKLERQGVPAEDEPQWKELARDAKEELELGLKR